VRHFYAKSIHFETVFDKIQKAVETENLSFLNMVRDLLFIIRNGFAVDKEFVLQSEIGITGKGTPLLVSIAKKMEADEVVLPYFSEKAVECDRFSDEGITIRFLRYDPAPYPQFWGPFQKNLSALDLLLCLGKEGNVVIKKGTYIFGHKKR
jgi:hypothetical protein